MNIISLLTEWHNFDSLCENSGILKSLKILGLVLTIIKIIIPIIIIVVGIVNTIKIMAFDDSLSDVVALKGIIYRIILGVVIFIVPSLVDVILSGINTYDNLKTSYENCSVCWNLSLSTLASCDERINIAEENERLLQEDIDQELIDNANNSANNSDILGSKGDISVEISENNYSGSGEGTGSGKDKLNQNKYYYSNNEHAAGLRYLISIPKNTPANSPLIVYLHGSKTAQDMNRLENNAVVKNIISNGKSNNIKFITIAPLDPSSDGWDRDTDLVKVKHLLDEVKNKYNINPKNIYYVGFSSGSFSGWHLMSKYPGYFNSAVLISGGPSSIKSHTLFNAKNVSKTRVKAIYGKAAGEEKKYANQMKAAIEKLNNSYPSSCATQKEMPGGHGGLKINADEDIVNWFFSSSC